MMKRNLLLLLGVIVLAVVPLAIYAPKEGEEHFPGADEQAKEVITEIRPDYQPWYSSLWEPPSGEVESLLFAVQAAIGAGLVCYSIGFYRGRYLRQRESSRDASS